jgi:hypothetical protein
MYNLNNGYFIIAEEDKENEGLYKIKIFWKTTVINLSNLKSEIKNLVYFLFNTYFIQLF